MSATLYNTTEPAPEPLLPRIARGDANAVTECVRRYGPLVWSIARRMSPTTADAEDAAQEVFMQVWKAAASFDGHRSSERTFIAMIARRRLIDRSRRQAPRLRAEVSMDGAAMDGTFEARPEGGDPDAHLAAQLIAALPDDRRTVLLMFLADGCTHAEIADRTGLPLGSVKSMVRRCLISVREQLGLRADGGLQEEGAP